MPRGWQRGQDVVVSFSGARLADAQEILFYEPGISVVKIEPVANNANAINVTFKIAPDARLGQYTVRVRTLGGISEARTFSVGQYPVIDEKEPNNEFAAPQVITMNASVHGVANNEDVDYYVVDAKKGERITAEVEAIRLGSALTDTYVAIMDMKRFEMDACDDGAFALQDPVASIIAPEDGKYVIQVRESSYAGNGGSLYRLHVGNAPRPTMVYPAGGKVGEEIEFKFLGDPTGIIMQKIKLPDAVPAGDELHYYLTQNNLSVPSANKLRVSPFANLLEVEPNNDVATATKTDSEIPLAFNGIIEKVGDIDFFRFKAKAGQQFDVRCHAKSIRSPLDPVLIVYNAQGGALASNDDSGGPDSYFRWGVPADGEYLVAVHDHLKKGGADYVYRVEFTPVGASLTLSIPEYDRNSQNRNSIPIPRGNRYATILRVGRNNFGGPVQVTSPELPQGVTLHVDTVDPSVTEAICVFEAAADAPVAGKVMRVLGAHTDPKTGIAGEFSQRIELVYGPPNNTIYYASHLGRAAAAVCEEAPCKITVVEPKVPLVQNGQMNLKVVAERKAGFTGPISLRMLWNPPGIGSANEVTIPAGQNEAYYSVNAGGAPIKTWKLAILATADEGKGPVWTSSQLFPLTVAAPYITMTTKMTAGEQGKSVDFVGELAVTQPFEGKATVTIYGMPPKATPVAVTKEITKDDKAVVFPIQLAPDAPVGQHKTMFAQIVITQNGEPIAHNVAGGSVLRIDPPPPPKPNAPPPPPAPVVAAQPTPAPAPAPAAAPPPKVLSRLEKLRLEAEERAKAAGEKK